MNSDMQEPTPPQQPEGEGKPTHWLIDRPRKDGAMEYEVVLSPLTDDVHMDEGDTAYPLHLGHTDPPITAAPISTQRMVEADEILPMLAQLLEIITEGDCAKAIAFINDWAGDVGEVEYGRQVPREALDMLRIMVLELNKNAGRISEETLTQAELCLARDKVDG